MGKDNLEDIVSMLLSAIENLPEPVRKRVEGDFVKLKELIIDSRAPRVLIMGRRGAGKSSLINAIFREKVADVGSVMAETAVGFWHKFENSKGAVEILDTRGIGDRTRPEAANFENAIDDIKAAVAERRPDVVMFLCKAKEVDAHVTEDVRSVLKISDFVKATHGFEMPVLAVVTQVDELDPKREEPPYPGDQKQDNIRTAVKMISDAFDEMGTDLLKVIPTSAYAEYAGEEITYDNFWNIDRLTQYIIEELPLEAQLQFARLSAVKGIQVKLGRIITGTAASLASGVAATPIPVGDIIPITAIQVSLIGCVGYIAGREMSKQTAKEFFVALGVNVGAGFALREASRAIIKYVLPGAGNAVSAGMAFAATWGIGEAAIAYFIEDMSIEDARGRLKRERESRMGTEPVPA